MLRADLSARAIRRIGGFVGAALIEQLVARGDLSEATRTHLNRRLRARLDQNGDAEDGVGKRRANRGGGTRRGGTLDDGFVENAAFAGNRETVILALAALAQVPEATVRKILSASAAPSRWWRWSGMRISACASAFKIQSLVMKLTGRELLPARGGINFPLTQGRDALASRLFRHSGLRRDQAVRIDMGDIAALCHGSGMRQIRPRQNRAARNRARPLISNS